MLLDGEDKYGNLSAAMCFVSNNGLWFRLILVICLGNACLTTGCDDEEEDDPSDSSVSTELSAPSLTGTWSGKRKSGAITLTMILVQEGDVVTGSYSDSAGRVGTVSGNLSGTVVTLTVVTSQPAEFTLEFEATANNQFDYMAGTYSYVNVDIAGGDFSATR